MNSLEDVPGYFNQTLTATDYLSSALPSAHMNKPEMSFHGPPSHLQNSIDVHPFWFEYGREYHPKERFIDRSMESIPHGLLPGADSAQEMRNIEIRETMQSLRQQVRSVWGTKIDEVEGEDATSTSPSPTSPSASSDTDNNAMTKEEKSTIEFFESMIEESLDFDGVDGSANDSNDSKTPKPSDLSVVDSVHSSSEDERSRNWHEPSLTSLLPNNLDHSTAGRVHGVVTEDRFSPKRGSPSRNVVPKPNHHPASRSTSIPNGHASFLKNSVYLPKESSISSLHRNTQVSPSHKAPPPPTKPKPKRSANYAGNKRYSYPMGASQPTEFGANFLMGNKPMRGSQLVNGNHIHEDIDTGSDSDVSRNNEQNIVVRNKLHGLKQQMHHNQVTYSHSFNQQRPRAAHEERTQGYHHSMYVDNNNGFPYHNYNGGVNGNKNNSNVVADAGLQGKIQVLEDAVSDDSAVDVQKDTSMDEVVTVLQGIEEDLISLQLSQDKYSL